MRVLVVEDNVSFYNDYLVRIFSNLLPMEKLELVHASKVADAIPLLTEAWSIILMDYALGDSTRWPLGDPQGLLIRNGADLITARRGLERREGAAPAFIIGTSSNNVSNQLLLSVGADTAFLKLQVPEMAQAIEQRILA